VVLVEWGQVNFSKVKSLMLIEYFFELISLTHILFGHIGP
jgi:hypothetical protein